MEFLNCFVSFEAERLAEKNQWRDVGAATVPLDSNPDVRSGISNMNVKSELYRALDISIFLLVILPFTLIMVGCNGGGTSENIQPTISSISPNDGAIGSVDGGISIAFSKPMDCVSLNSGGFVLADTNNVPVPGNLTCEASMVTFTPELPMEADRAYTASLTTQAVDINGNALAYGRNWSFTTKRAWRDATLIEHDDSGFLLSISPKVASDRFGNAIAVWGQGMPNTTRILSCRYSSGAGWGVAAPINDDASSAFPEIAIDANGNAIAVWEQFGSSGIDIWSNRYSADLGWGKPELVETAQTGGARYPKIAMDKDGNTIAVWQQGDGSRNNIWANYYLAGKGWGVPELLEGKDSDAEDPRIAMDASGEAYVVWLQTDSNTGVVEIWSNHYLPGVGWGMSEQINVAGGQPSEPDIASDGNGGAIAVWSQWGNSGSGIWANISTKGHGWGTAFPVETDDTAASYSPRLAADTNGNAIVLWTQQTTITYTGPCIVLASAGSGDCNPKTVKITNLWSSHYSSGIGWSSPELVETNDQGDASQPQVAFDKSGKALAVWVQNNGAHMNIWANNYKPGLGWGAASVIQSDNSGDAMSPNIAVNSVGSATAVWGQSDGARANVWANRLY